MNSIVTLRQSEVERVSQVPGVDFKELPFHVQKDVAIYALLERGDRKSLDTADLLRMNNPNIQGFTVIDDVR